MPSPTELTSQVIWDPKRSAEVNLFNQHRLQLAESWVVFYSVAWLGRFRSDNALHDGETDFIIAHSQHGMLLIEVKGGCIDHDGAANGPPRSGMATCIPQTRSTR